MLSGSKVGADFKPSVTELEMGEAPSTRAELMPVSGVNPEARWKAAVGKPADLSRPRPDEVASWRHA